MQSPEFSSHPSGPGINWLSCWVSAPAGGSLAWSASTTGLSGTWIPDTTRSLHEATQRQGCKDRQNPPFLLRACDTGQLEENCVEMDMPQPAAGLALHGNIAEFRELEDRTLRVEPFVFPQEVIGSSWCSVPGEGRSEGQIMAAKISNRPDRKNRGIQRFSSPTVDRLN